MHIAPVSRKDYTLSSPEDLLLSLTEVYILEKSTYGLKHRISTTHESSEHYLTLHLPVVIKIISTRSLHNTSLTLREQKCNNRKLGSRDFTTFILLA